MGLGLTVLTPFCLLLQRKSIMREALDALNSKLASLRAEYRLLVAFNRNTATVKANIKRVENAVLELVETVWC